MLFGVVIVHFILYTLPPQTTSQSHVRTPLFNGELTPQNQTHRIISDKFLSQHKRLCDPIRRGMLDIGESDTQIRPISQHALETREVRWRGDD